MGLSMNEHTQPHADRTSAVLRAAFAVSNELGAGFLEKVYEHALAVELRHAGCHVATQVPVRIVYREETVGDYVADMIVDHCVLVEIKAAETLASIHVAQTLNYLRATRLPVALLLNFGTPKVQHRRLVLTSPTAGGGSNA